MLLLFCSEQLTAASLAEAPAAKTAADITQYWQDHSNRVLIELHTVVKLKTEAMRAVAALMVHVASCTVCGPVWTSILQELKLQAESTANISMMGLSTSA